LAANRSGARPVIAPASRRAGRDAARRARRGRPARVGPSPFSGPAAAFRRRVFLAISPLLGGSLPGHFPGAGEPPTTSHPGGFRMYAEFADRPLRDGISNTRVDAPSDLARRDFFDRFRQFGRATETPSEINRRVTRPP
jgi:hypothetical protein